MQVGETINRRRTTGTHRVDRRPECDEVDLLICASYGVRDEDAHGSINTSYSTKHRPRSLLLRPCPVGAEVTDLEVAFEFREESQLAGRSVALWKQIRSQEEIRLGEGSQGLQGRHGMGPM